MTLTDREKEYNPKEIEAAIENHKANIKTFEEAIQREYEAIKRYRKILAEL